LRSGETLGARGWGVLGCRPDTLSVGGVLQYAYKVQIFVMKLL